MAERRTLILVSLACFRVALGTTNNAAGDLSLGNVYGLGSNASTNLSLTLATGALGGGTGTYSSNIAVTFYDASNLSGAATNGTGTLTVTGNVYGHANGSLTNSNVVLQSVHVGYTNAQTKLIGISNAAGFNVALKSYLTNSSNNLSLGSVSNVVTNSASNAILTFGTNQGVGSFTNVIGVVFGDDSTLAGASATVGTNFLTVSGLVYTGQATWTSNSGNWTNLANWDATGGTPGLDGALSINDSATFGTGSGGTVTLDKNAGLNALTFSNSSSYTLAGSGTISLVQGSNAPSISTTLGSHTISNALSFATNVTVTNADGSQVTLAGSFSGSGGLTQMGAGTTILSGNNTYGGDTVLNAGTMVVNGSISNSSSVTVNTGSTLSGSGTLSSVSLDVAGGTLAPTGTNGMVISGNLNFTTPGSAYQWSLFGNTTNTPGINYTASLVVTNGSLSVTSGLFYVNLAGSVSATSSFWTNGMTNSWQVMSGSNVGAGTNLGITLAPGSVTSGFSANMFFWSTNSGGLALNYYLPPSFTNNTGTNTIPLNNNNVTVNSGTLDVQGSGTTTIINLLVTGGMLSGGSNSTIAVDSFQVTGGTLSSGTYQAANYVFAPSDSATVNAGLSDAGTNSWALISNAVAGNAGTTVFNSAMTYTGGTLITNATLQLGSGTLTGSLVGLVTNNGVFQNGSSGTLSLTNLSTNITGNGIIAQAGTGTMTLDAAALNNFTGSFAVFSNGTLAVTNTNSFGGGTNVYLANGGTIQFRAGVTNITQSMNVTNGTGVINNASGATLGLNGTLTKSGSILVLAGGTINVNGLITGSGAPESFDSDIIIGSTNLGAGTVTLNSSNNYHGPTYVTAGSKLLGGVANALPTNTVLTLGAITDGSVVNRYDIAGYKQTIAALASAGNASNIVTNSGAGASLTNNGAQNTTYGGLIAGNIALIRSGTGMITLTQNNTYTGGTKIDSGKIVTTASTALGTGGVTLSVGSLEVRTQTLNIASLNWNTSGQVMLPQAGSGIYLNLTNSGTPLSLAGIGNFHLKGSGLTVGAPTALLGATNGSFGTNTTADFSATVDNGYSYSMLISNNILYLTLLAAPTPTNSVPAYPNFVIPGLTPNQLQVAGAMNNWASNNPTGDQVVVLNALTNIPSSEWAAAYDQMSPRYYQQMSTIAFNLANAQNNELVQRMFGLRVSGTGFSMSGFADNIALLEGQGDSVLDAKKDILRPGADTHWGMFVDGNGMFGSASSGNMLPNYNFQSGGITTGLTYQWSDTFLTGLYAGYQGAYAKNAGLGTLIDNSVRFGLISTYGSASGKGFYADALLGGGYNNYQVSRTIQFGSINRTANSSPGAGELDSMIAAGYNWKKGNWAFGPIGSLQYTYFGMNSFNETGAQSLNLNNQGWNASSMISSLGANCAYSWQAKKDVMVVPQINLGWQHEFMQNSYAINSTMDGTPYSNSSAAPIRDTLYTGVGVTVEFKKTWNTAFFYNASAGNSDLKSQNIFWSIGRKF